jgi:hypothetical protein
MPRTREGEDANLVPVGSLDAPGALAGNFDAGNATRNERLMILGNRNMLTLLISQKRGRPDAPAVNIHDSIRRRIAIWNCTGFPARPAKPPVELTVPDMADNDRIARDRPGVAG